jgi:membrane-associated phospholipid phosphatase
MPGRPGQSTIAFRRSDAVVLIVSIVVAVVCGLLVRNGNVPGWEADVFDGLNGIPLPGGVCGTVKVLQNAGSIWAPLVPAVGFLVFRRYWTAVAALAAVGLKQVVEFEFVKELVVRQRPRHVQANADTRCGAPCDAEAAFPSGHAIVLFFTAAFVASLLPRRWTWVPYSLATLIIGTRVIIGAHSPLDAVAGAAIGLGIAALCNLVFGALSRFTSTQAARGTGSQ